jgi:predicted SprT family Zn-dependent metalloprotease
MERVSYATFSGDERRIEWSEPVPERFKTELRRVTVCEHDERLEVKSVRGIGFSWRCTCGERGLIRRTRLTALDDKREHEQEHRTPPC